MFKVTHFLNFSSGCHGEQPEKVANKIKPVVAKIIYYVNFAGKIFDLAVPEIDRHARDAKLK